MLTRKMFRDMKGNFGQFFSIFILSALAIMMFTTFQSSTLGAANAMQTFNHKSNLADVWMYGENFTQENLEAVKNLKEVKDAQLRMMVTGKSVKQGNAQVDVYLEDENIVTKPYVEEGAEFDPADTKGLWLSEKFADYWKIKVGDEFSVAYNGITITGTVRGLISTPEYEYMCADTDLDTDVSNIAYVYMSYRGFSVRDYVNHLISDDVISISDILKNTHALDEAMEKLHEAGMTENDITKEMLLEMIENFSDEKLFSFMPYTQLIFTTDVKDVFSLEKKVANAIDNNYAVYLDKSSIPGLKVFADEMAQHKQFSYAFSIIFVLIAILVIVTSMKRIVEQQRTQIGTMNAMGVKRFKIAFHYVSYSLVVSLLGALVGLFVGPMVVGQELIDVFLGWYTLPGWKPAYSWKFIAMTFVIVLVCAGTSYLSCRKLMHVAPSEALRPAPPKAGKKCIFEKLPFWNKLGFQAQYNLRDISRSKLRAFMCVFGTACGMMLICCGFGCDDTLKNVKEWMFDKMQNYQYQVMLKDGISTSQADKLEEEYSGELVMTDSIEVATKKNALHKDKATASVVVTEGKGYYNITDVNQNVVEVEPGTVALTSKLAKKLGVKVGDTVYWHIYAKNEWYGTKVSVISRNPSITGITILREDFEKLGGKFTPYMLVTDNKVTKEADKNITVVHNQDAMLSSYKDTMELMYVMVYIMVMFSALLVVIVLYNSGNLSFNERVKEFATLKVMGFQSKRIRRLISMQNLCLSVIGVLVGAPFGRMVLQSMFDSNGDSFDYQAVIGMPYYILSGAFVLLVSCLVSFMFSKRIKKLDMVEVLKGME